MAGSKIPFTLRLSNPGASGDEGGGGGNTRTAGRSRATATGALVEGSPETLRAGFLRANRIKARPTGDFAYRRFAQQSVGLGTILAGFLLIFTMTQSRAVTKDSCPERHGASSRDGLRGDVRDDVGHAALAPEGGDIARHMW